MCVAPKEQVACVAPQAISDNFLRNVVQVAGNIQASPTDLLAVMYSETNGTLRPDIWNGKIAVGLIQFTKTGLGTVSKTMTLDDMSKLSGVAQMDYVEAYFKYWAKGKPLDSAGKLYTIMFLPGLLGHDVLASRGEENYDQNSILDFNQDGVITTDDLTQLIAQKVKGARLQNLLARMAQLPPATRRRMSRAQAVSLLMSVLLPGCTAPAPAALVSPRNAPSDAEAGRVVDGDPVLRSTTDGEATWDGPRSNGAATPVPIVDFRRARRNVDRARAAQRRLTPADRKQLWPEFDGVPVVADAVSTHFTSSLDEETLLLYGEFPASDGRLLVTAHHRIVASLSIRADSIDAVLESPSGPWLVVSGGGTHMGETSVMAFVVGMAGGQLKLLSELGEVYHDVCGLLFSPEMRPRLAGTDPRRWTTIARVGELRTVADLKLSTTAGSCGDADAP